MMPIKVKRDMDISSSQNFSYIDLEENVLY